MAKNIIYTLPGLGFDERIFSRLNLSAFNVHHLNWIKPAPGEAIQHYAQRLADKMTPPPENCILIGHSFGGIMAQEIAALVPVKKIILISSIKSKKEKPLNFRSVAPLGLHHFFSKKITLSTFDYWGKYFGYDTVELQGLFKEMIAVQSDVYLQWALYQLSIWEGVNQVAPVVHIHGEKDKTFPFKLIAEPVSMVKDGTHMMVYQKGRQVSELIKRHL
ncbi:MAG: alpha/beta hydrolase [Bacteroidota bacterium]